jgi:trigger factor
VADNAENVDTVQNNDLFVVQEISSIKRKVKIQIDTEKVNTLLESKLKEVAKKANIKGFRPGKAPISVIKKFHEAELLEEAKMDVLNDDFKKLVSDKNIMLAGNPSVDRELSSDTYEVGFEILPNISSVNLDLKIKKTEKREITEAVLEDEINYLLERMAEPVKLNADETINDHDRYFVHIDYVTIDSENNTIDSAKDYALSINSGTSEKELESSFNGKKIGDSFEFDDKEKGVTIKGVIKNIEKKIMPVLTEDILKHFGDFESVEDFKKKLKGELDAYEDKKEKQTLIEAITQELIKNNPVEIPESMIEQDAKARFENLMKDEKYKNASMTDKQKQDMFNILKVIAKKDIISYLLIENIGRLEKIEVDDKDIEDFYRQTSKESGLELEEIKKLYENDRENYENLKNHLLEEKIYDFIIANKVSYV